MKPTPGEMSWLLNLLLGILLCELNELLSLSGNHPEVLIHERKGYADEVRGDADPRGCV